MLRRLGTVEIYFDDSWDNRQAGWVAGFEPQKFECIVILQAHECFRYLNADHPNIVFVPMYDAMIWQGAFYWQEIFNSAKVLCLSSALQREIATRNPASVYFQYFPDPEGFPAVRDYSVPRGYYWRRTNQINCSVVRALTEGFFFDRFTLHDVPDPGCLIEDKETKPCVDAAHHRITGWENSEKAHLSDLSEHNIYFAPRLREGIGFGFLKAMSMGLCVVAPDTATHNEYIAQGCSGLLYGPDKPEPIDLRRYREMGLRARDSIIRGRQRWNARTDELLEFVATPKKTLEIKKFEVDSWISPQLPAIKNEVKGPTVAVVTVCLNAREEIAKTICSVAGQDYPNLEYVICDGGSSDGTVDVIRSYQDNLAYWSTKPDAGVYPAMQQSLDHVKSDWVMFMNAGDFFVSADAVRRMFAQAPPDADVIFGHHVFRHTGGGDEVRLAADFGWMWARLQEGNFDVQYPAGFPAHQATCVRTRLLRKLRFDALFRIAADHDLLWRAFQSGAKFFNADEVVSVYRGGGMSARLMERCKLEWCVIALRYGTRKGALRLKNCTDAELARAIELEYSYLRSHFTKLIKDSLLGRIPLRLKYLGQTADSPSRARSRFQLFTRHALPTCVSEVRGFAEPEEWGTWSEGDLVEIVFRDRLPSSFLLILNACAFGPNIGKTVFVSVGQTRRPMLMKGRRHRIYRIAFDKHDGDRTITFSIPSPSAPSELQPSQSSDTRRIGVGFVSLKIEVKCESE